MAPNETSKAVGAQQAANVLLTECFNYSTRAKNVQKKCMEISSYKRLARAALKFNCTGETMCVRAVLDIT